MAQVKPIPDGYAAVTPYLTVKGAAQAIDFYRRAFGAEETLRMPMPNGRIAHAELRIGGSVVMLSDESEEWQAYGPLTVGGTSVALMLYVPDVDATVQRAVDAGATLTMAVADQFYGDRTGGLKDPFGHKWHIATHVEDVAPDELQRRAHKLFGGS